ncbi:pseudouridine synthase, putative [Perkinsus marinus ATCC 50983]|uniref:Pseudouridine synthase, putative n=1 Tax=Perkinsus marinus (strain ATCC 50983 / TXsc) TaxID=423536 RepID=C5KJS4_PERM5|nr:pseudouridine synthase, putative [Perkinsus marinus ATCC 50983]EER15182.1 pseudouridine synthase, putative [Perkinsus marinus ATCC 50983]|eukprot:XP_002783386.1 pseudouridine synthase, putative [Perkinsus marinus ATCC 50983]
MEIPTGTEAGRLIERGRISINGRPIVQNRWVNVHKDSILVNGTPLEATCRLTLLMHKPAGYVVSRDDPLNRDTVFQLLPDPSVYIGASGRLDKDTTGLLLLTNDTYLQSSLVDPVYKVPKVYRVVVKGAALNGAQLMALRSGVSLEDGPTLPALVEPLDVNGDPLPLEMSEYDRYKCKQLNITLWEGRNRQVRRMVEAVGSTVRDLCRIQLGPFSLHAAGVPNPGDVRQLTIDEVETLKTYINSQAMRTKRFRKVGIGSSEISSSGS